MLGKLLSIATIGGTVAGVGSLSLNSSLLQRLVSGLTTAVALTVMSAFMVGLLMMAGFCGLYLGLTHYGLDPAVAMLMVMGLMVIVTVVFVALAVAEVRELKTLPFQNIFQTPQAAVSSRAHKVARAFFDGFFRRSAQNANIKR